MRTGQILERFTAKDGRELSLKTLHENELEEVRHLFVQVFREDKYLLDTLREKHQRHPSLFIGCFDKEDLVGIVFGWPDPEILVVKAIAVMEPYRRKGIGTVLLKAFGDAATKEGFENFVLGAEWEAVPFYISFGLKCFANVQIKPEQVPWNNIQRLRSKYEFIAAVIFGPSTLLKSVSRLCQELNVKVGTVGSGFESISIQIRPKEISKESLGEIKRDLRLLNTVLLQKRL